MKIVIRAIVLLIVGLSALWSIPTEMSAQSLNKAAVVIRHYDDSVETACVSFEEPQISGLDLLAKADLDMEIDVQGGGTLVCKINDTGCPAGDCWCQCKGGGDCIYWSYWYNQDEKWTYSQLGVGAHIVEDGAVDGWSWGPGAVDVAVPPPDIDFDQVCHHGDDAVSNTTLEAEQFTLYESSDKSADSENPLDTGLRRLKKDPENQRTILGSGIFAGGNQDPANLGETNLEVRPPPFEGSDWLPYAGFIAIISALTLLMIWVKRK